ncbi:protein of unknown function DUF4308 [Cynara cardunculus var. scolymus]|uniref:Cyanobacterial aminoacyl-tRNA synthetase CAAD domain-containing protein n=1 Tax=Cynara cardunculus var. scolymus TaxID=59895 RepID=A0A103XW57_CYNCS|nr:protein of unknown function DUF4308 [Cynara cardunculus var. scolymus]
MAYLISNLPLPPLFACEKRLFCTPINKHTVSAIGGFIDVFDRNRFNLVLPLEWDKPEDRIALVGFGFAAVVVLWASLSVVTWFVYRYLLFKPDRKELVEAINKSVSDILGQ